MKKTICLLIIAFLLIPTLVNAAQCDTSKVYIDSITMENTKGEAIELEDASAKDKKVNLNLRMSYKNDEVLYKIIVKNDSNEDYSINKNNININSNYVEYSLESDDSNIIKAKSTKTIYLRVNYSNEVNESNFIDGKYLDNITMKVNLESDDLSNPNTGISYILIISLILLIGILFLVFRKNKLSALIVLIGIIIIPCSVKALCSCELVIDSNVVIQKEDTARVIIYGCWGTDDMVGKYNIGMTLNDLIHSLSKEDQDYLNELLDSNNYIYGVTTQEFLDCLESSNNFNLCYDNHVKRVDFNDKIKNKEEAIYVAKYIRACITY